MRLKARRVRAGMSLFLVAWFLFKRALARSGRPRSGRTVPAVPKPPTSSKWRGRAFGFFAREHLWRLLFLFSNLNLLPTAQQKAAGIFALRLAGFEN